MAIQSNYYSATTGVSSGTCTFTNAQTAGNTNVIFVGGSNFTSILPTSVTDSSGNMYILLQSHTGEMGGYWNTWMYICIGIAGAVAGANIVSVVMNDTC